MLCFDKLNGEMTIKTLKIFRLWEYIFKENLYAFE